ncbi:triose-phosphate isomerase [Alphaproteobacteria bacterium]|nr:triose-phosphate isomerase [Alphaproteobacteria bacterium]
MLIAGNWKLNCNIEEAKYLSSRIIESLDSKKLNCEVAIFPSYICLDSVNKTIKKTVISLGSQDCSVHKSGAYTGDVSANMLFDTGCKYVIVGHSERRMGKLESNNDILSKANNALESNLIPIICVGENAKDREDGRALEVIKKQLDESVPKNSNKNNCILAYEPIWAIGSGKIPDNSSINEMLNMIKGWLSNNKIDNSINILYGGSVNKSNAKEIFSCINLGGLLIGGVSLKPEEFSEICLMAN